MSALASPRKLEKAQHLPGAAIARQLGVPVDEKLRHAYSDGGRLWLPAKLVTPSDAELSLEGLTIERLADWADGATDTDWMLPVFWGIVRGYPECKVGEIGMRNAISTMAFALAARDVGGHVWSIDIDECIEGRRNVLHAGLADYHTFIHGDSAACEFPEDLDVLFIDGEHNYQAVTLDFGAHIGRVRKGGTVLFHDTYSCPEVKAFCDEIGATCLQIGAGLGVLGC
jgi:hypothetical protein